MNIFTEFASRIRNILHASDIMAREGKEFDLSCISVESPRDASHGDLATNVAMVLAKSAGENPIILAERIAEILRREDDIASVEVAWPGFINLRLTDSFWLGVLTMVIRHGTNYGRSDIGRNIRVNVEYVSANPTGPLHIGHCRGAVVGDVLANLLRFAGYDVVKEYYINDTGMQVNILARSALLRYREALGEKIGEIPEGLYPGDYLLPVGHALADKFGSGLLSMNEEDALPIVREHVIDAMINVIRDDLAALGIHHDFFFSERMLHADHAMAIRSAIDNLAMRGHIYRGRLRAPKGQVSEGWENREQTLLRSTEVGDDMDRPLIKPDGSYTYFASDVAYFKNKYDRGFHKMIYILGADHGGYIKRLEAVAKAVSDGEAKLTVILCQLVKLYRNGKPMRMSKRSGNFITLRDVVDEVGRDPVRFMMLYRKSDAPLDFDFAKVTEQSRENPVFYVQYASARCHSVFRQAKHMMQIDHFSRNDLATYINRLDDKSEIALVRKLAEYPSMIEMASVHQEPHRLAFYLYKLASAFHGHWNRGNEDPALRFVQAEDRELTLARLGLVRAIADVLTSGLCIIGAEAPDEMRG